MDPTPLVRNSFAYFRAVSEMHRKAIADGLTGSYGPDGIFRWDGVSHPYDTASNARPAASS
jgi:hypothetical protein